MASETNVSSLLARGVRSWRSFARGAVIGALLGALVIGCLSRLLMRILTYSDGREPGFSAEGTMEILLYGALVGAISGVLYAILWSLGAAKARFRGLVWGALTYLITVLTLPAHIASTAVPFRTIILLVHGAFLLVFLVFGVLLVQAIGRKQVVSNKT